MKHPMKSIAKEMSEGSFQSVYEQLERMGYDYTLDRFTHDFGKVDSAMKYSYLLYMIVKQDSPKLRLLICNVLMFTDTFFHDRDTVIHWHLAQALAMEPNSMDALQWIIDIYYGSPDSPFSGQEMYDFARAVIAQSPQEKRALEIIRNHAKGE